VNKDGEIIINSIKIIKTIYKFHYQINVVAEPPEVAHGILEFHETQFENRQKSDTEKNKLRSTWRAKRTLDLPDPFLLMQNMGRHAANFPTLCTLHLPWENI